VRAQERERERRGARKREIPEKVRGVCKTDRKKDRQRQTDRQADRGELDRAEQARSP